MINKKEYMREYKKRNKSRLKALAQVRRAKKRDNVIDSLGGACVDCGCDDYRCLEFDHLTDKQFKISVLFDRKEKLEKELVKCQLVCCNCHLIRTNNRIKEKNPCPENDYVPADFNKKYCKYGHNMEEVGFYFIGKRHKRCRECDRVAASKMRLRNRGILVEKGESHRKICKHGIKPLKNCSECRKRNAGNFHRKFKNKEKIRSRNKRDKRKEFAIQYLGSKCKDCNNEDIRVLVFDHIRGKVCKISECLTRNKGFLIKELDKCELVCANCHSVRTKSRIPKLELVKIKYNKDQ